jgi:hypothetical protein
MLRCKGVEGEEPERSVFRIFEGDAPAPEESLARVARVAEVLLRENALAGRFLPIGPGILALELSAGERTFFHNGIVFAALDAINDPIKNPTLNLRAGSGEA